MPSLQSIERVLEALGEPGKATVTQVAEALGATKRQNMGTRLQTMLQRGLADGDLTWRGVLIPAGG